jgi:hypothetical protein
MRRRRVLAAGLAALSSQALPCQSTWTVGPGAFADVGAALAVANPGDTVLVTPGGYPQFTMNAGVTIRAVFPRTVSIGSIGLGAGGTIPAGQTAHLVGLDLSGIAFSGGVDVDDCRVFGPVVLTNATAVLQDCTIQLPSTLLGGAALDATQTDVTVMDCMLTGTGSTGFPAFWRPVIALTGSRLTASRLIALAASNVTVPALEGDAASTMWLCESAILANAPACAIAGGNGRHDRCLLVPSCSSIPAGFVLGVHRVGPLVSGAVATIEFALPPGAPVGVFAATSFAAIPFPVIEQSLLLPPTVSFPVAVLLANAQGTASGSWAIPGGAQNVNRVLWLQGIAGLALPLQASALVGGVVR